LWVPCSFVQRAQQGGGRVEVADGGLVKFLPVKVNLNLKTETCEELKEKKKRLHLVSARAMVEEVRYELDEWAKSAEAAARLQKDPHRNQGGTFTAATLAAAVVKQCEDVVKRHEAAALQEYVDDGTFRALVSEMLDAKAWAKEKKELWVRDMSSYICFLQGFSLRESHRQWLGFLKRSFGSAAAGSSERKFASLELLSSRGLVLQGIDKKNVDGEGVMVQAGADGWQASDIAAAAAAGADINAAGNNGWSGVSNAARFGNAVSLAALLSSGGDVKQNFSVINAVYNGHADCLQLLLAAGGDVNKCANDGTSPIYIAAQNGCADCLQLLLAAGGDVNKCANDGASPIFIAAQNGRADCLQLLLAAGGDVNKCRNDGTSPIYVAAGKGRADCLQLLLAVGGDVNKCRNDGTSPIFIAAQNGRADCLQLLLAAGGDVNKCANGTSPIYIAAQNGCADCLQLLLAAGGDVNKCRNDGVSPIFIAAEKGRADCLQLLLAAGGDVNKCRNDGTSPIFIAAQKGRADCLKLLLGAGSDPRSSWKGTSALDISRQKKHAECVRVLEAALA
jgi:ankyrin repeat protein